ncbi:hypothetical protein C7212DRAFT_183808 [Tuber magnatum]|uniref:Zn(2)-C6 fungal-type domain-containing protein n=1 Tax=Tuber magnatum TaxID=42249 RepID=A0A317SUM7_9PEZI|nr:hypothetical protein C7212DRAFT_183808 [Tuber magnatum]
MIPYSSSKRSEPITISDFVIYQVKCDERPGACSNCQKLDIDCPGYSPINPSEAPEETVSAIFARAGRKRRRMVGSCVDCRASKSKCSSDRPTCERCAKRGITCEYDETLRVLEGRSLVIPDAGNPNDRPSLGPIPGDQWAKKAQNIMVTNFAEISPERLMALVLLCEHHSRTQQSRECFMLSAFLIRAAQALDLDMGQEDAPKTQDPDAITECEARRRLMWSCYIIDLLLCSGVKRLMLWDPMNIKAQLPCQERNYTLQILCETESLYPIRTGSPSVGSSDNLGIEAYFIRLFHIRGKVLEQIRNPNPYGPPWSTSSPFQNLTDELVDWENTLPDSLLFNNSNVYVRRECRQLGAFFGLHLVYHQVFCDLYRISLPGYPFPAAATFNGAPDGFVAQCQSACNVHAARISEIFEMSFTHGWKALVEPMCSVIAFESSKHQIVYFTACSSPGPERRKLWDALACNLAVNIKALNDIRGYSRAAEECVGFLPLFLGEWY